MIYYFIALLISHLTGDVFAYSPSLSEAKRSKDTRRKLSGTSLHCLIHSLFVFFCFKLFRLDYGLSAAIYIFIIHYLIDTSRLFVEKILFDHHTLILKRKDAIALLFNRDNLHDDLAITYFKKWLLINFFDQSLHFFSILAFAILISN